MGKEMESRCRINRVLPLSTSPPAPSSAAASPSVNVTLTPEQFGATLQSFLQQALRSTPFVANPASPGVGSNLGTPSSEQALSGESAGSARQGAGKQLNYVLGDYKKAISRKVFLSISAPSDLRDDKRKVLILS